MLERIVLEKKTQLEIEKEQYSLSCLEKRIKDTKRKDVFRKALSGKVVRIIAEIKKASPSKGTINDKLDHVQVARLYEEGGADAISVLTEEKFFLGSDRILEDVREVVNCPVLRKDFVVDEYQLFQTKALGADAVLLIVALLKKRTKEFYTLAKDLGLECLVEVHDEREVYTALEAGVEVIGINNRDLKDFSVSLETTKRLVPLIPDNVVKVSESGIKTYEDINYLRSFNVNAFLIGETLSKSKNIYEDLKSLKGGK